LGLMDKETLTIMIMFIGLITVDRQ
jgi:hypothetical protein